jgi:hypothetical protein
MPPQAEGEGSTRSLNRKAVKDAIGSGLVKTSASWSREGKNESESLSWQCGHGQSDNPLQHA